MREALRVLETMGLVEIRKGTQGGVFVAEVDMKTTISSMMNFLHFTSANVREITMMRFMLEPSIAQLAAERISDEDIEKLRSIIESQGEDPAFALKRGIGFHRYLARMSDNPILILIMDFIDNILRDLKAELSLPRSFHDRVKEFHLRILDCLAKRDGPMARRLITADLLWVGDYLADTSGAPRFIPSELGYDEEGFRLDRPPEAAAPDASLEAAALQISAQLANEDDAEKFQRGMMLKQLGSGEIYLVVPRGQDQEE
jgi:GntR family transcriptional repressor for pyruvate dehydrogenase complex